jgi:O-antigen ligase
MNGDVGLEARLPAGRRLARVLVLFLLVAAPLAFGSVHEPAFIPLLVLAASAGGLSLSCEGRNAARVAWSQRGVPVVAAYIALVLLQLVPLPPTLLRLVSPGTYHFHERLSLVPLARWLPISVNPLDTGRGLAFLFAFTLLYVAVCREAADSSWRRSAMRAVALTGLLATVVGLVQAASPAPGKIYGLWEPTWTKAVFGPFVNHNHFAGYVVMAIPLALGFAAEALGDLVALWRRGRRVLLSLGDPPAMRAVRWAVAGLVLVVGLFTAGSRGGLLACPLAFVVAGVWVRRARLVTLVLIAVALTTLIVIDTRPFEEGYRARGFSLEQTRLGYWRDVARPIPEFLALGAGFNAFGTLSPYYRTYMAYEWLGQAHNEYLQVLIDTGVIGLLVFACMLAVLARAAFRAASASLVDAGLLTALAANSIHNIVEFNWQIPATAATFIVLAGLVRRDDTASGTTRGPAGQRQRLRPLTMLGAGI